mmetsp:Transcript_5888/g.22332  ORF Transcript_5888/g.22332 Transcript_5888/m.22332 type:complete len:728 (-) Transcript_5888:1704-3887(-)
MPVTKRKTRKSKPPSDSIPNQHPVPFNSSSISDNTHEPSAEEEKKAFEELDLDEKTRRESFEEAQKSEKTIVRDEENHGDEDQMDEDQDGASDGKSEKMKQEKMQDHDDLVKQFEEDEDIMRDDDDDVHNTGEEGVQHDMSEANEPSGAPEDSEEDELLMEYEVYLTHKLEGNLFMIQYPLRPKDRSYDFKTLKNMAIKHEHKILTMDFELNQHTPDFDTDSEFKKKTKHSLRSTPVPLKSNYCIGVLRGTSLFITPLLNISKMLPDTQYLNEHFDTEVRMVDDEPSTAEGEEGGTKKKGRKKSAAESAEVMTAMLTKREQREQEKSYHWLKTQEEKEKAVSLDYMDREAFASSNVFEQLLTAPFGEITFDMTPDEYMDTLVPYKEDPLAKFNKKVISLDVLRHVKNAKSQLVYILQAAKIISFKRIRELATRATGDEQILQILPSLAFFIRGRWIGNSITVSEPGLYERWSYMLLQFRAYGEVKRGDFAHTTRLTPEKAQELLETIAELDKTDRVWRLKGEEDLELGLKYPQIIEEQGRQLDGLEKEMQHHVSTGFTKVSTQVKDSQALAASALTEADIKRLTGRFLIKLAKTFGVVSSQLIRVKLQDIQTREELYKKITVDNVKQVLPAVYRRFNKSFVNKKYTGLKENEQRIRDVLVEEFDKRKSMTKEDILDCVKTKLGTTIPTNLFFKFTEELCKKPKKGSKTFEAKTGNEALGVSGESKRE